MIQLYKYRYTCTHVYIHIFIPRFFSHLAYYKLLSGSLYYTLGACCLAIVYKAVCISESQTSNLSPPHTFSLVCVCVCVCVCERARICACAQARMRMCAKSLRSYPTFCNSMDYVTPQAPLSLGFFREDYWVGKSVSRGSSPLRPLKS